MKGRKREKEGGGDRKEREREGRGRKGKTGREGRTEGDTPYFTWINARSLGPLGVDFHPPDPWAIAPSNENSWCRHEPVAPISYQVDHWHHKRADGDKPQA